MPVTPASQDSAAPSADGGAVAALSFEDALKRLEAIVQQLERGDVPLEQSIALYAEGDRLRARCEERLKSAQARIDRIQLGPDGGVAGTTAFDAG